MEDKVFPDDLIKVILDTTFRKHGVEVENTNLNPSDVETLKTTSMELLERVDEFLKRSRAQETTPEPETVEPIEEVQEDQEDQKEQAKIIRRSFWGHW